MEDIMIKITKTLSKDAIEDFLVTALEGGIGYWAAIDEDNEDWEKAEAELIAEQSKILKEVVLADSEIAVKVLEMGKPIRLIDDSGEDIGEDLDGNDGSEEHPYLLTLDKIAKGLTKYFEDLDEPTPLEDFDAIDADMAIQYAIFGEVILG